ncbi:VOC family protein [Sphingomonas sinipercae]|uniref:VOC family protein n=1 Tax=Sphingomonas sinipercae TaxID=2714944 RepID=A0A6G7ZQA1_9SPHN|nr:VOC family protein [Sphingomonas sinipercae]QIL03108.1 VOC family protein [Sphingomonas sinipercae]
MEPPANKLDIAIGHVVLAVRDVEESARFYSKLGLHPCQTSAELAILELRGGTHLLLMRRKVGAKGRTAAPKSATQTIDLMISGRTRDELEACRDAAIGVGLDPTPIPPRSLFGHYIFHLRDPDGNDVAVATSHSTLNQ